MKKYLLINPFGIGDVLFTTSLISAIKDAYPDSFIGYWCNQRVEAILKNDPRINKIFALSRGDLKKIYRRLKIEGIKKFLGLILGIRKERFDAALDFSLDHRYSLVAKILGITRRIGFNYKKRGRFLTDSIDIEGYVNKHIVEYYLDLLKFLNIKPGRYNLSLLIPEDKITRCKKFLEDLDLKDADLAVGIAPGAGASWGQDASLKHWPAVKFSQLADRLIYEFGAKVIILGDTSEKPIAEAITNMMKNKPIDLAGKINLEDLPALIKHLNILVTNDGGPLHIAVALGIKTVSIFGPVDEKVYGPYPADLRHLVIKKELSCRPCYQKFKVPVCLRDRECINSINVEEVMDALRRICEDTLCRPQ